MRKLEHVIARSVLRAAAEVERGEPVLVRPEHLGQESGVSAPVPRATAEIAASAPRGASLREDVDDFQRARIRTALDSSEGNWAGAARVLGLHRSTLHRLARRWPGRRAFVANTNADTVTVLDLRTFESHSQRGQEACG